MSETAADKRRVVFADGGDRGEPCQPVRRGGQVVGANSGEVALAECGQCGGFVIVGEYAKVDSPGDDAVLDVVHRIGDVVSPVHHLSLQAGPIRGRAVAHPLGRPVVDVIETELAPMLIPLPRVLGDRVQRRPRQVETNAMSLFVKGFGLQAGQDPKVLRVPLEATVRGRELVEGLLAVVPVGRVPDVVCQTGHVDEVRIASQSDRHPPSDLGDLQRMGQSRPGGVPFSRSDDLRLVRESAQRGAVQNPRAVPGEIGAELTIGARQTRALRRLGHYPLAVEIVIGVLLHHRRTVCQSDR